MDEQNLGKKIGLRPITGALDRCNEAVTGLTEGDAPPEMLSKIRQRIKPNCDSRSKKQQVKDVIFTSSPPARRAILPMRDQFRRAPEVVRLSPSWGALGVRARGVVRLRY